MITIRGRNVNHLFVAGLHELASGGRRASSRAGDVCVMACPVMSVYERPTERVLFDEKRDANPFFHLMEGLWMLSGSNDPAFLDHYIHDFGSRFADGGVIHGAYGHRWRTALGFDQLDQIVRMLTDDPGSRQAVLQMWDASEISDAWQGGIDGGRISGSEDLTGSWKDRPCNTHCYFRVREPTLAEQQERNGEKKLLDMTILCRSNDVIWGAYGANAVHFSMLMEYVAGRLGCGIGTMFQFSNNYHGYVDALDKIGDPSELRVSTLYDTDAVSAMPMGDRWDEWDNDLYKFMAWHESIWNSPSDCQELIPRGGFRNSWFDHVACPVAMSNWLRKQGRMQEALAIADKIEAHDWHQACRSWLLRRKGAEA